MLKALDSQFYKLVIWLVYKAREWEFRRQGDKSNTTLGGLITKYKKVNSWNRGETIEILRWKINAKDLSCVLTVNLKISKVGPCESKVEQQQVQQQSEPTNIQ